MANLKDIRNRIKSVKSIQKVTKAMKLVAAAKMRRAQERLEESRPYSNSLAEVIQHLLPDVDRDKLPLLDAREVKRKAYVVVSADRGLAGAFNTNLLKVAQKEIDAFNKTEVAAVACASLFHFGDNSPMRARSYLKNKGIKMRSVK